ncbi:MAG: DUF4292 domain-containing protein [Prevotellaceae bacterium]|nr:DUF4292 domain-containing protein [Prevotella sp.]MDD7606272.1 DUF4292 domain-containing protein [Prevotellaceae bacterium]
MRKRLNKYALLAVVLTLTACGAKKNIVTTPATTGQAQSAKATTPAGSGLAFVQQVADQSLYQKNITGNMTFSIQAGSVNHKLGGALHMRRDEVIRLQVVAPILPVEIGRIEFTPDYVLVVDRWHKEYIKADYNQLAFLKENGLDFYSLQSLFWNELLMPGRQKVGEGDLGKYYVDTSVQGSTLPVSLSQGKLSFCWNAGRTDHKIHSAIVTYGGSGHGSSRLTWNYADFQSVGVKSFPATQSFTFTTSATGKTQQGTISFTLDRVGTDSRWEARTTVSDKYKRIEARDVFDKLLNLQ